MQERAAAALDTVLSPEASWRIHSALSSADPVTVAAEKALAQAEERARGLAPEAAAAVRDQMRAAQSTDISLMREGFAATRAETTKDARALAPLAAASAITPAAIEAAHAALAARTEGATSGQDAARRRMQARRALWTEFGAKISAAAAAP
jgi:hypothetical protein